MNITVSVKVGLGIENCALGKHCWKSLKQVTAVNFVFPTAQFDPISNCQFLMPKVTFIEAALAVTQNPIHN